MPAVSVRLFKKVLKRIEIHGQSAEDVKWTISFFLLSNNGSTAQKDEILFIHTFHL
jgi:hypothetical protein